MTDPKTLRAIESALDAKRMYSTKVNGTTISIRPKHASFQITVTIPKKEKPLIYLYRKREIAIERFQEKLEVLRRR